MYKHLDCVIIMLIIWRFCTFRLSHSREPVAKASTIIGIEISPNPPLIFTDGQKVRNLMSFSTSLTFEPPAFENATRYPNSETSFLCRNDRPISSPSSVMLGPRAPGNRSVKLHYTLKLHSEKVTAPKLKCFNNSATDSSCCENLEYGCISSIESS